MTKLSVFECDLTGERFGARNDVIEIEVKRRWSHNPFGVATYTVHVNPEAVRDVEDYHVRVGELQHIRTVGIEDNEIMGAVTGDDGYRPRDDVVIDHHEEAFQFIEEELVV